jgi:hypothetical protein
LKDDKQIAATGTPLSVCLYLKPVDVSGLRARSAPIVLFPLSLQPRVQRLPVRIESNRYQRWHVANWSRLTASGLR